MPGPHTRDELARPLRDTLAKLVRDLRSAVDVHGSARVAGLCVVDSWSTRDLLAVRLWWARAVLSWTDAGLRGEVPTTPAEGYAWRETPRLNADIVAKVRGLRLEDVLSEIEATCCELSARIDELDDRALFAVGAFEWCGKWPLARWIAINSTRQLTTARTMIRKALRSLDADAR